MVKSRNSKESAISNVQRTNCRCNGKQGQKPGTRPKFAKLLTIFRLLFGEFRCRLARRQAET
jgi:hypothetical protein